jgi:hypothetical protein
VGARGQRDRALQREEFLPSAYWLIVTIVAFILILLMATNFGGLPAGASRLRGRAETLG